MAWTSIVNGSNKFSNEAHWGSTFWLTGANRYAEPGQSFHNSISADQVAAAHLGKDTRFGSIQLNTPDAQNSGHGPGLSLAWDVRGKPLSGLENPVAAFHRLFSDDTTPLTERHWDDGNRLPDRITLFQRVMEEDAEDDDEVGVLIEETLIHEVGHYFGLSEEEIEAIEEQYWRNGADADER